MKKKPIQHYVSKMFIRRFMNGKKRLHTLSVDTSNKGHGTLTKTFGEKGLWSDEIEQKLGIIETKINKLLKVYDAIVINKKPEHKCTVWVINNPEEKDTVMKMALLQPNLLKDLKDGKKFEKNIIDILDGKFSLIENEVFYVKLYNEYCNGKFIITDYLGQAFIDDPLHFNSIPTITVEELTSGKYKSKLDKTAIPAANYFITGEYELFFVGKKEQLDYFLNSLLKPTICFVDESEKEYELIKKKVDFFEITTFNLNEIKSQESQCEIASYDEEYLQEIKKTLPSVVSSKIMFRNLKVKN